MATALIVARVRIDLEGPERFGATTPVGMPIMREGVQWQVSAVTLDNAAAEYVRVELVHPETGEESTQGPLKITRMPGHVLALISSARMTLRVIEQLQAVTTDAVR